jgi:hypothetical protein
MKQFCINAICELVECDESVWAETFIRLRYRDFRKQFVPEGMVFSTLHGADFFVNLLNCLNGAEWTKKDEAGELGDNFRKLIQLGR